MNRLSVDSFIALCRSADSPAILKARGLTAQETSNAAQRLSAECFAVRLLDGAAFNSKADLLVGIAAAFQFPGYFGRNWDALIDCWSDMSWLPANGYICIIEKANVLEMSTPLWPAAEPVSASTSATTAAFSPIARAFCPASPIRSTTANSSV